MCVQGFFSTCFSSLGGDAATTDADATSQDGRRCVTSRWRVERAKGFPKGCGLSQSAPKCPVANPITFHLDPSIPDKARYKLIAALNPIFFH